jgi:serine/threonine-protein kinase
MGESLETTDPREDHLDQILAAYLEAVDGGWAPGRRELLARYPGFRSELEEFFASQDQVRGSVASLRGDPGTPSPFAATLSAGQTAPSEEIPPPQAFGDYDQLEEIARGAMGVVFRARQKSLNRPVAIKMMLGGRWASADDLHRFRNEAEAAASMDHPNIVSIYEVGSHEGHPYLTMRLIEGGTLTDHLPRLVRDVRAVAELMVKVARAVDYAHQRGILHRDLKPGNILLDQQGEPHVADFGLAKRVTEEGALTTSGAIVGTPWYMSQEQAGGQTRGLTTSTEVYSLGVILYELLTGRVPFRGADVLDTLLQVRQNAPVPPRALNERIDADLETIVLKCLRKEPGQRYGTAAALADDLERWLRGEEIQARRTGMAERLARWVRRSPVLAGLLAAVVGVFVAGAGVSSIPSTFD